MGGATTSKAVSPTYGPLRAAPKQCLMLKATLFLLYIFTTLRSENSCADKNLSITSKTISEMITTYLVTTDLPPL